MMAGYLALVNKDAGTSYGVSFPDVPGCVSAGDTLEAALANAAEALAGHLALMASDGDPIPVPRSFEAIRADAALADDLADAIVAYVPGGYGGGVRLSVLGKWGPAVRAPAWPYFCRL